MAVNGISGSTPILPGLQGTSLHRTPPQAGSPGPATPLTNAPVTAPTAQAPPAATALQQNAQLISEVLQNLSLADTGATDSLLARTAAPLLNVLAENQEPTPLQQSALRINETLQNLSFVPTEPNNPLLINELAATLEAAGVIEDLNSIQSNALQLNTSLQELGLVPSEGGTPSPAAQTAAVTGAETAAAATATIAQTGTAALAASPTSAATAVSATETTMPVEAQFLTQELNPASLPLSLFPDRTPYVLVVYHFKDPAPPPGSPEPLSTEIPVVAAVTGMRPAGATRLRQLLQRVKEIGRVKKIDYNTPRRMTLGQAEKSIRLTLDQLNQDLATHVPPLHFVFAKNENGFALDLYDCSYNESCRLSYDVPIVLSKLPGVLGKLEHETGIVIDTES